MHHSAGKAGAQLLHSPAPPHSLESGGSHPQTGDSSHRPTGFCCCIQLKVWETGKGVNISPCPKSFMAKATWKVSTWKCKEWGDKEGHKGPCFPLALNILVFQQ